MIQYETKMGKETIFTIYYDNETVVRVETDLNTCDVQVYETNLKEAHRFLNENSSAEYTELEVELAVYDETDIRIREIETTVLS